MRLKTKKIIYFHYFQLFKVATFQKLKLRREYFFLSLLNIVLSKRK